MRSITYVSRTSEQTCPLLSQSNSTSPAGPSQSHAHAHCRECWMFQALFCYKGNLIPMMNDGQKHGRKPARLPGNQTPALMRSKTDTE